MDSGVKKLLAAIGIGSGLALLLSSSSNEGGEVAEDIKDAKGRDVEAAARMIASENPSSDESVWVEQVWTQLRKVTASNSLYSVITGGRGWGSQGGSRPVSTDKPATDRYRQVARDVIEGRRTSLLPGARKFFDPRSQDAVMRQVIKGKADIAAGKEVSKRTKELIAAGYKRTAQDVRDKWSGEGDSLVGTSDGVEFWT